MLLNVDKFEIALVLGVKELDHVLELEVTETAYDLHYVFEAAQVDLFAGDLYFRLELLELGDQSFARLFQLLLDFGESFKGLLLVTFTKTLVSELSHEQFPQVF